MNTRDLTITAATGARLDLVAAATAARARTTITGASTLSVDLPEDHLTASLTEARTAAAEDREWKLVAIHRRADSLIRLTYEDHLIAALRAHTDQVMYQVALPAAEIIGRFCTEAGVPVEIDPALGEAYVEGAGRSILEPTNSWREIVSLVDNLGGRTFSDGARIVVAPDRALLARDATRVTSARGAVTDDILFQLDTAQQFDRAEFAVDATWTAEAGTVVDVYDSGPADGRWLVADWSRGIPRVGTGRVRLTRPTTIGV